MTGDVELAIARRSRQSLLDQRHQVRHVDRLVNHFPQTGRDGLLGRFVRGVPRDQNAFDVLLDPAHAFEQLNARHAGEFVIQ